MSAGGRRIAILRLRLPRGLPTSPRAQELEALLEEFFVVRHANAVEDVVRLAEKLAAARIDVGAKEVEGEERRLLDHHLGAQLHEGLDLPVSVPASAQCERVGPW